ncbi:hypothetical protein Mapa_002585 [Marchantia paleacea]|nr:hypothetical protein Mapa_002585 [Marchantia paleacea]
MSFFGTPASQPAQSGGFNVGSSPFGASSFGSGGMFSTPQTGGIFGASSTPAFGASTGGSLFGNTTSAFGGAASTPSLFGSASQAQSGGGLLGSTPTFGQPGAGFGQSSSSLFGQSTTPSLFGQQQTPSLFGQSQPQQSVSQPFSMFGQSSLFGQSQPQPQSNPFGGSFGQTPGSMFGGPTNFNTSTPQQMFQSSQLTTQMAPVAPLVIPLPDREAQAFIDAYKEEPGNPKYAFKHLLLSVTDPSLRVKPVGVSDIMWAEAMNNLAGMESADRERLWPELVQGFKDLSNRMKLQDDCIAADVQRLQATETNVKLLHRHFDTDTVPWIQRLRHKEQELQRRLLKVMRIVEALEGKGFRMPLTKGEAKVGEQLRTLTRQLQGSTAELPRKVDGLLSRSRMQAGVGQGSAILLGPGKIEEQSLGNMHEVLRQQTEAIAHITNVLKKDTRDIDIMLSENADMVVDGDASQRAFMRNVITDSSKVGSPFKRLTTRLY